MQWYLYNLIQFLINLNTTTTPSQGVSICFLANLRIEKIFLVFPLKAEEGNIQGLKESFQERLTEIKLILIRAGVKWNREKGWERVTRTKV